MRPIARMPLTSGQKHRRYQPRPLSLPLDPNRPQGHLRVRLPRAAASTKKPTSKHIEITAIRLAADQIVAQPT
jgi:hypothetical protein